VQWGFGGGGPGLRHCGRLGCVCRHSAGPFLARCPGETCKSQRMVMGIDNGRVLHTEVRKHVGFGQEGVN